MKKLLLTIAAILAVANFSSCGRSNSDSPAAQTATDKGNSGQNDSAAELKTIIEIAAADSRFSTLTAAVVAADLAGALSSEGPFTVLAPTNDAFAKLPAGTVDFLLSPENKAALQNILLYHVLSGTADAATVVTLDGQSAETLSGASVKISVRDGNVFINDSRVIITDIKAKNGIIHVLDTVLHP